ncbi:MAG: hypothetical protein WAU82_00980 [Candidatus Binatus sp.]|uniref:hypothetical protein n=1 Tax=Candidatus Binatus sp. TaxID=2811406 RepID=UPI003BB1830C
MDAAASLTSPVAQGCGGQTSVVIGGLAINIQSANRDFIAMLERRYAGFVAEPANGGIQLEVEVVAAVANSDSDDEELEVRYADGHWTINRGDFRAQWDPVSMRGSVRQAAYPYAIDAVMRIVHSLVLAERGGFLVHSASAVRNGRAFLFSGVSGAGKTTISRLAPPDVTLLTDEISYVRRFGERYQACGTPFAGDLGRAGENISAPIAGLYLLVQGRHNVASRIGAADAARRLLRNILFFADDANRVEQLFGSACDFVSRVPVYELTFQRDEKVWDLIG